MTPPRLSEPQRVRVWSARPSTDEKQHWLSRKKQKGVSASDSHERRHFWGIFNGIKLVVIFKTRMAPWRVCSRTGKFAQRKIWERKILDISGLELRWVWYFLKETRRAQICYVVSREVRCVLVLFVFVLLCALNRTNKLNVPIKPFCAGWYESCFMFMVTS